MKYSSKYSPPAPGLKVRLIKPLSNHFIDVFAKLDTGADITMIPQYVVDKLRLIPASRILVSTFNGYNKFKYTYFVDIIIHKYKFSMIETVSGRRQDALLGRDILNKLKIIFDGKNLNFDIQDP
ncbi:MAG TPA: hypothetical protein ENG40_00605 [Thermoprotei archaeon]|nr:hypothetical protein [Thermoprotei archaeon]